MERATDIDATVEDNSSDRRRLPATVAALIVLVAQVLVYVTWRGAIHRGLFGGDTVNISLAHSDSYLLSPVRLPDLRGVCAEILAGRDGDAVEDTAAFVYQRLSPEGRRLLVPIAEGRASAPNRERFRLELHRSLIEVDIDWPQGMLAQAGFPAERPADQPLGEWNLQIVASGLKSLPPMKSFRRTWSDMAEALPQVAKYYFTQTQPTRYSPLTNTFVHMVYLLCLDAPDRTGTAMWIMGAIYGLLMAMVFLLAAELTKSIAWALLAMFIFQFSTAAITMSFLLFALPYLFVPLVMTTAVVCYVKYKSTGRLVWLGGFVVSAVAGPWFREFPGAIPFVVVVCEILTFRRWRSVVILAVCLPLMLHCVWPSWLPWLLGFNPGKVYGVYEQTNTIAQASGSRLHWQMLANMVLQFPPVFWVLTLVSIGYWIYRSCRSPWPEAAVRPWIRKVIRLGILNSPRVRRSVPIVCAVAFLAIVCTCAFYMNQKGWTSVPNKVGRLATLLGLVFVLLSLRFGVVLPIYVAMIFPVFLKVQLAEVHLTFVMFPLAILVVLWIRDLVVSLRAKPAGARRMAALLAVGLLGCIGLADHGLNLYACVSTQKELVRANRHMGKWIRDNTPRHGIVLCNFYNLTDVFYYSGYHFDPYETKANCPMGPKKVVDTAEKLKELYDLNSGARDIYFLAAEQDFRPTHVNWDAHRFARKPPGPLTKLAVFSARNHYWYADPLRWFTPRRLVSFPGYMDWADDFYVNNLPAPFRRVTYADYTLYKLESLEATDSSR